ncbi:DNA-3-methyladenine glycosylase 1 [Dermatophilus congolensis]|uniref:DNA-3-methyladenine glycosylase 1 n=1 Tax=Dermatophilus congolensis TaxID=1863 RepID=A0A239VKH9_9MICO|nr:DNA-3-methyladenine glycosylase I [Dermatophilus congolensis]SNV22841.1 DNA-3-methyladenine glycosylase 1 [Dermatophilus congolensis]
MAADTHDGLTVRRYVPITPSPDLVTGEDGLARTPWAYGSEALLTYYDTEWGMPVRDERGMFERLSLEVFQAGLSWETILRKRESFRRAFDNFSPDSVCAFDDVDIERLVNDPAIVRHRGKIMATLTNARATCALRGRVLIHETRPATVTPEPIEGGQGLAELVWSYQPQETPEPFRLNEIPSESNESAALSAVLKKNGFLFVGPTSMYALMEAVGIVDTHLVGSHRRGASGVWRS